MNWRKENDMRISKLLSAACAAAFLAASPAVRAQDTPAQAAARAALMNKMSELDTQQSQPTNSAPPAIVVTPSGAVPEQVGRPTTEKAVVTAPPPATAESPAATPAPRAPAQPVAATPKTQPATWTPMPLPDPTKIPPDQMQPPPTTSAVTAPAPAIVLGATIEQPGQPTNETIVTAPSPATAESPAPTPAPMAPAQPAATTPETPPTTPPSTETQPAAPATTVPETAPAPAEAPAPVVAPAPPPVETQPAVSAPAVPEATPPPAPVVVPAQTPAPVTVPAPSNPEVQASAQPAPPPAPVVALVVKPSPANAGYAGKTLGFKPIEGPPPPVSAQKEAELQALLARYMANQITPEEYQKGRAAILAEP